MCAKQTLDKNLQRSSFGRGVGKAHKESVDNQRHHTVVNLRVAEAYIEELAAQPCTKLPNPLKAKPAAEPADDSDSDSDAVPRPLLKYPPIARDKFHWDTKPQVNFFAKPTRSYKKKGPAAPPSFDKLEGDALEHATRVLSFQLWYASGNFNASQRWRDEQEGQSNSEGAPEEASAA